MLALTPCGSFYSTYSVKESKRLVQVLPERSIITSIRQNSRRDLKTLAGKVLSKDLLSDLRTLRRLGSMLASISISYTEETLGDHVEVKVDEKVVDVLGGEVGGVEFAAEKTVLFGAPPCEADLVLSLVL